MAAVTYDREADVLYVELADVKDPGIEGEEVHPGVVLMFDAVGKLIGVQHLLHLFSIQSDFIAENDQS